MTQPVLQGDSPEFQIIHLVSHQLILESVGGQAGQLLVQAGCGSRCLLGRHLLTPGTPHLTRAG